MAPMQNEYFDVAPTRGQSLVQRLVYGQRVCRLHARLRAACAVDQRLRRQSAAVVDVVLRAGRLEGDRQADVESGLALRLHDAAVRSRQPHGELRSGRERRRRRTGVRRATAASKTARWSSPTRTTSRRASVSSTSSANARFCAAATGTFYNQFERIGSEDQLALNPPGLRNIDVSSAVGCDDAGAVPAERVSDRFPRSSGHWQSDAALGRSQHAAHDACSSLAAASNGKSATPS